MVTRIAVAEGGNFRFPHDAVSLFSLYDRLHAVTAGAVDPLIGRDLELLGYDASYSLTHDPIAIARYSHERPGWSTDIRRDGSRIHTSRPLVIDVGAAGKGYLVDIVAEILRGEGIDSFVVDGGGDLAHSGPDVLDVSLEHSTDPGCAIGIARLRDRALCASAVNRRAWG